MVTALILLTLLIIFIAFGAAGILIEPTSSGWETKRKRKGC